MATPKSLVVVRIGQRLELSGQVCYWCHTVHQTLTEVHYRRTEADDIPSNWYHPRLCAECLKSLSA